MLNPSTADGTKDDPTIRRCMRFAREWGYGGLVVVNLFAFRCTKSTDLWSEKDPIGPDNDNHILKAVNECKGAVAAWGSFAWQNRSAVVRELLISKNVPLYYLELSKQGNPKHPLYLKANLKPQEWP